MSFQIKLTEDPGWDNSTRISHPFRPLDYLPNIYRRYLQFWNILCWHPFLNWIGGEWPLIDLALCKWFLSAQLGLFVFTANYTWTEGRQNIKPLSHCSVRMDGFRPFITSSQFSQSFLQLATANISMYLVIDRGKFKGGAAFQNTPYLAFYLWLRLSLDYKLNHQAKDFDKTILPVLQI